MRQSDDSRATRSVVLVTATELEPRTFGKQVVLGGLLDHLRLRLGDDRVHVIQVGRDTDRQSPPYQLHVVDKPTAIEQLAAAAGRVLLPPHSSLQEAAMWSPRVLAAVSALLLDISADLELWDTMRMGQYARAMTRRRRVLYADDLFSNRYASMLERARQDPTPISNPLGEFGKLLPAVVGKVVARPWVYRPLLQLEQRLTTRSENTAPAHFDATVLVSPEETAELRKRTGDSTVCTLLPLIPQPGARRREHVGTPTFVFLGGLDFAPNRDGLAWFLSSCRESVLNALPDFRLLLVGKGWENALLREAEEWGEHVQPLGWVKDLDDVLLSCAGLLSPLRIGSGTKIKVMEALSRGLPVVATPAGVLGLGVGRQDGCLVGQSPEQLARLLVEAADGRSNTILSDAALNSWRRRFSPAVASTAYDEVLQLPTGPWLEGVA